MSIKIKEVKIQLFIKREWRKVKKKKMKRERGKKRNYRFRDERRRLILGVIPLA